MTAERSIERRETRLENDRDALHELLDLLRNDFVGFKTDMLDFKTETGARFDRIDQTLVEVVRRLPEPS